MIDTNHIEQRARELLAAECDRTVEGMRYDAHGVVSLNVALSAIRRALSARASAGEGGEQLTTPPAHGDGEALVSAFEDAVIRRIRAYDPDDAMPKSGGSIREELAARNALLNALTIRPTPEAQEANWVNDLWNRRRAEAADLDKGEEFEKGMAEGIRSVLVEVVMFVTKGAAP